MREAAVVELLFEACLLLQPDSCRVVTLTFTDVPVIQCQMGIAAQSEVAKWLEAHPNHFARKRKCRLAGQFAKA